MNKKQIVASLKKIANELDNSGLYQEASSLTNVMIKIGQFYKSPQETYDFELGDWYLSKLITEVEYNGNMTAAKNIYKNAIRDIKNEKNKEQINIFWESYKTNPELIGQYSPRNKRKTNNLYEYYNSRLVEAVETEGNIPKARQILKEALTQLRNPSERQILQTYMKDINPEWVGAHGRKPKLRTNEIYPGESDYWDTDTPQANVQPQATLQNQTQNTSIQQTAQQWINQNSPTVSNDVMKLYQMSSDAKDKSSSQVERDKYNQVMVILQGHPNFEQQ